MTIRFKEESGEYRIKDVTELEVEGVGECKASGDKWRFEGDA